MAMATALAGVNLSFGAAIQRNVRIGAENLQGLRAANPKCFGKSQKIPLISASSESVHSDEWSQGASAIAGALFAAMATQEPSLAAQQLATLATDDLRALELLVPLVPALGWVLWNILQPGLNQFNRMKSLKGVSMGLGAGGLAFLASSLHADAAVQEIAQVADSDSRGLVLLGVLLPAIGWVLFNILRPALNQFDKMKASKGFIGALGLGGATLLLSSQADAAQEFASIADSDSRGIVLLGVLLPAIGWVLFNILQPALNQLNKMNSTRGLIGAVGLGAAASSFLAADAEAAQEITQLAADNRPLILLFVLLPAIGWVLYNILRPALNQFNKMKGGK